MRQLHEVKIVC